MAKVHGNVKKPAPIYTEQDVLGGSYDATNQRINIAIKDTVPGTAATNLGKAEDAAHASGDTGVMLLGVRKNTAIALAGTDGDYIPLIVDTIGALHVNLANLIAGEDLTNNVLKTEQQFSYSQMTGDTAVKSGAGFLHTVTFSCADAAPTAGTIDIYDNTAESGTKIFTWTLTTAVFNPTTIILDVNFATGLYVGFTTTADVSVTVSYR